MKIYIGIFPHEKYLRILSEHNIGKNLGKTPSEENKRRTREALLGVPRPDNVREKISKSSMGKILSETTKTKISNSIKRKYASGYVSPLKGKLLSQKRRTEISVSKKKWYKNPNNIHPCTGKTFNHKTPRSTESRKRYSISKLGKLNPMYNTMTPDDTKRKLRISMINYITQTRGNFSCNVGKNETAILNFMEMVDGCKITRNYAIHDLGYFPDGYCLETNTIYEVFESYHMTDYMIKKDINRLNLIKAHLHCNIKVIFDIKYVVFPSIIKDLADVYTCFQWNNISAVPIIFSLDS